MTREEQFKQLKQNEQRLVAEKTSAIKFAESCTIQPQIVAKVKPQTKEQSTKADAATTSDGEEASSEGTLAVKVVANTANWMDSQGDVLTAASYSESIAKRGATIPHILDHNHSAVSHIGDVQKVYVENIAIKDLGVPMEGTTAALIFETNIRKDYNPEAYTFYKNGKINQHSIGLRYQELCLALNSNAPEDASYKEVWDKYYPDIINKELADAQGHFWAVTKVDVIENSAVLFGANQLTPTLSIAGKNLTIEEPAIKDSPTQSAHSEQGENTMTLDEALKKNSELEAELKNASAVAIKAERDRCLAIMEAAKTFGLPTDNVVKAVTKGWDAETATDIFTEIKAGIDAAKGIDTSVIPFGKTSEQVVGAAQAGQKSESGLIMPTFATANK